MTGLRNTEVPDHDPPRRVGTPHSLICLQSCGHWPYRRALYIAGSVYLGGAVIALA